MSDIKFGTLVTLKGRPDRVDVVTHIIDFDKFGAYRVFTENGIKLLRPGTGGTISQTLVESVVGQMTLEEITEAVRLGFWEVELANKMIENLTKKSTER